MIALPEVDLTATAAALGLNDPPSFEWNRGYRLLQNAEYDPDGPIIRIHPTVFTDWEYTAYPKIFRIRNARNGLRFIAAHELAHAWQEQRDPDLFEIWGDYAHEQHREFASLRPGMTYVERARLHRRFNRYEAEADDIARRLWRTVKLLDSPPRKDHQ